MPDGFLVVDKPAGITSHDVVARVRRTFGMKRVGHTGTLDPFATGVLPVALGGGTKAIPFLDEALKEYQAVMRLGAATDTQDVTGKVISTGEWSHITREIMLTIFSRYTGSITQIPPMFSAVKQDGIPLYKLARKGETVERKVRQATIHSIIIDKLAFPDVTFTVRCSRGTYVRTLADDIGRDLGCGAHLVELRRTVSGLFDLFAAIPFTALTPDADLTTLAAHIIPPVEALGHLSRLQLTADGCNRVRHGMIPVAGELPSVAVAGEQFLLLCSDRLVAVAERLLMDGADKAPTIRLLRVFDQECPLHAGR